ncbi:MAG: NEW3 domain-containing protein [Candidatus Thermoplasmatota archaeon]|nr:NEW3 domain-containing protein [Candidatus Thermoplasmatota archaeon]
MAKGVYSILVSLIALLLVSPISGINHKAVANHSELLSGNYDDTSRDGDYDVTIEFAAGNEGISSVTRNEESQENFIVTNNGNEDDTYTLSVSWSDPYDLGWHAEPDVDTVSVSASAQETISFNFKSPVQGVDANDDMAFTVKVTSQNSTSTNASVEQLLEIDMIYAVDISAREGDSRDGDRGQSVSYLIEVANVGDSAEEFRIEIGSLPKDWTADTSVETIYLDAAHSDTFNFIVSIPDTAAENESAVSRVSAHVQQDSYDYIYGYCYTTTTVNDGRIYGVNISTPYLSKQAIPGGHALYDLYVTNTGEETDSFILSLGEVEPGWHSNLSQFNIDDLGPDEEVNVVLSVTCPSDSVKDDWSLASVGVASSNREQFYDNLTTTTSVRIPERGASLTVDVDSMSGNPGSTMIYSMTLTNNGTDPDDFSLSVVRCDDCSAWGVSLSTSFVEDLGADKSHEFEFYVEIPPSARNTDSAVMNVVATSVGNSSKSDRVDTTTLVNKIFDHRVTWNGTQILNPGDTSFFDLTLFNEGNSFQSYTFELTDSCPSDWDFEDTFPYTTANLNPYTGEETFSVHFQVPSHANPGFFNCKLDIVLDEFGSKIDDFTLSVEVEYYADFIIDVIEIESFAGPGTAHVFNVDLTNKANAQDEIALHIDDLPEGWIACINPSACVSSITVPQGGTVNFDLSITSLSTEPANTTIGAFMSLVGVSGLNDKVTNFDTFTVYTNPVYHLSAETPDALKEGVRAGETITFILNVTNNGNAKDYVSVPSATAPSGWISTFSTSQCTVDPSKSCVFYLTVNVPETVHGGDNVIHVKVSSDQSGQTIEMDFVASVTKVTIIDVDLKTTAGDVLAGTTGEFTVRLTNSGNTFESLSLSIEGKRASWFSLPSDTASLGPGDYLEIIIKVDPPITQVGGDMSGILNVTFSSDTKKMTLPFTVLTSTVLPDDTPEEAEESLLPAPGLIAVLLVITIVSRLRRRI